MKYIILLIAGLVLVGCEASRDVPQPASSQQNCDSCTDDANSPVFSD